MFEFMEVVPTVLYNGTPDSRNCIGALEFGNAGQPAYDGRAFAAYQDVILVSVNYRTNSEVLDQ